jgi:hypothetical protein
MLYLLFGTQIGCRLNPFPVGEMTVDVMPSRYNNLLHFGHSLAGMLKDLTNNRQTTS